MMTLALEEAAAVMVVKNTCVCVRVLTFMFS